jgi:phosphatidate cytidylyltransferase
MDWASTNRKSKFFYGIFFYIIFLLILFGEPYRLQILIFAIIFCLSLSIHLKVQDFSLKTLQNTQGGLLVGMIYLSFFPALLVDILFKYQGAVWFLSLLVMVFAGDIGAYSFGITMGKRHVLPQISPKKTWEGAIGGFLATLLSAVVLHQVLSLKIPMLGWLFMAGLISISAQTGDFFESLLKRVINVKDSGKIMPGHGGLLDRIDGLLFAAPIMSVSLNFFDRWI